MDLKQMEMNIRSFLIKELDAPCSADTHLNGVLFSVIEQLGGSDLDKIFEAEGEGFHAILEISTIVYKMQGKPTPAKYQRFFDKFEEWTKDLDNL